MVVLDSFPFSKSTSFQDQSNPVGSPIRLPLCQSILQAPDDSAEEVGDLHKDPQEVAEISLEVSANSVGEEVDLHKDPQEVAEISLEDSADSVEEEVDLHEDPQEVAEISLEENSADSAQEVADSLGGPQEVAVSPEDVANLPGGPLEAAELSHKAPADSAEEVTDLLDPQEVAELGLEVHADSAEEVTDLPDSQEVAGLNLEEPADSAEELTDLLDSQEVARRNLEEPADSDEEVTDLLDPLDSQEVARLNLEEPADSAEEVVDFPKGPQQVAELSLEEPADSAEKVADLVEDPQQLAKRSREEPADSAGEVADFLEDSQQVAELGREEAVDSAESVADSLEDPQQLAKRSREEPADSAGEVADFLEDSQQVAELGREEAVDSAESVPDSLEDPQHVATLSLETPAESTEEVADFRGDSKQVAELILEETADSSGEVAEHSGDSQQVANLSLEEYADSAEEEAYSLEDSQQVSELSLEASAEQIAEVFEDPQEGAHSVQPASKDLPFLRCETCHYQTKIEFLLNAHVAKHALDSDFSCPTCDFCESNSSLFVDHLATHQTESSTLECYFCHKKMSKSHLKSHMVLHKPVNLYDCSMCEFSTNYVATIKRHTENVHYKEYTCSHCALVMTKLEMQLHMKSAHGAEDLEPQSIAKLDENYVSSQITKPANPYDCSMCEFSTNHVRSIKRHNENFHYKEYKCSHCAVSMTKHEMQLHVKSAHAPQTTTESNESCISKEINAEVPLESPRTAETEHTSAKVSTEFSKANNVCPTNHQATQSSNALPVAPAIGPSLGRSELRKCRVVMERINLDGLGFEGKSTISGESQCLVQKTGFTQVNGDNITKKPTFHCNACIFKTKKQNLMQKHVAKHSKDFRLTCPYCGYKDISCVAFAKHIQIHQNDKNAFKCCFCNCQPYRKLYVFSRHLYKHRPVTIVDCPKCEFSSYRHDHLKGHIERSHTKTSPCPVCGKVMSLYRLSKHMNNARGHGPAFKSSELKDLLTANLTVRLERQASDNVCEANPVSETSLLKTPIANARAPTPKQDSAISSQPEDLERQKTEDPVQGRHQVGGKPVTETTVFKRSAANRPALTPAQYAVAENVNGAILPTEENVSGLHQWYSPECPPATRMQSEHHKEPAVKLVRSYLHCSECIFTTKRRNLLQKHVVKHLVDLRLTCPNCGYKEMSSFNFANHTHGHQNDKNMWNCCFCDCQPFRYRRSLVKHLSKHRSVFFEDCPKCQFSTYRPDMLRVHIESNHTKRYPCRVCDKVMSRSRLSKHMTNAPGHGKTLKSSQMRGSLVAEQPEHLVNQALGSHCETNPVFETYALEKYSSNGPALTSKQALAISSQPEDLTFKRPVVNRPALPPVHFDLAESVSGDTSSPEGRVSKKLHPGCSPESLYPTPLPKIHPKTVNSNIDRTLKPYLSCSKCRFQTRIKSLLRKHVAKHLIDDRFTCTKCDFKESCSWKFARHWYTHNTDAHQMVKCCFCTAQYKKASCLKGSLPRHFEEHRIVYLFDCPKCKFSCSDKYKLGNHYQMHHVKKHRCKLCGKLMTRKRLSKHVDACQRIRCQSSDVPSGSDEGLCGSKSMEHVDDGLLGSPISDVGSEIMEIEENLFSISTNERPDISVFASESLSSCPNSIAGSDDMEIEETLLSLPTSDRLNVLEFTPENVLKVYTGPNSAKPSCSLVRPGRINVPEEKPSPGNSIRSISDTSKASARITLNQTEATTTLAINYDDDTDDEYRCTVCKRWVRLRDFAIHQQLCLDRTKKHDMVECNSASTSVLLTERATPFETSFWQEEEIVSVDMATSDGQVLQPSSMLEDPLATNYSRIVEHGRCVVDDLGQIGMANGAFPGQGLNSSAAAAAADSSAADIQILTNFGQVYAQRAQFNPDSEATNTVSASGRIDTEVNEPLAMDYPEYNTLAHDFRVVTNFVEGVESSSVNLDSDAPNTASENQSTSHFNREEMVINISSDSEDSYGSSCFNSELNHNANSYPSLSLTNLIQDRFERVMMDDVLSACQSRNSESGISSEQCNGKLHHLIHTTLDFPHGDDSLAPRQNYSVNGSANTDLSVLQSGHAGTPSEDCISSFTTSECAREDPQPSSSNPGSSRDSPMFRFVDGEWIPCLTPFYNINL